MSRSRSRSRSRNNNNNIGLNLSNLEDMRAGIVPEEITKYLKSIPISKYFNALQIIVGMAKLSGHALPSQIGDLGKMSDILIKHSITQKNLKEKIVDTVELALTGAKLAGYDLSLYEPGYRILKGAHNTYTSNGMSSFLKMGNTTARIAEHSGLNKTATSTAITSIKTFSEMLKAANYKGGKYTKKNKKMK